MAHIKPKLACGHSDKTPGCNVCLAWDMNVEQYWEHIFPNDASLDRGFHDLPVNTPVGIKCTRLIDCLAVMMDGLRSYNSEQDVINVRKACINIMETWYFG